MNKFKVGLSTVCLIYAMQLGPHAAMAADTKPGFFESLFAPHSSLANDKTQSASASAKGTHARHKSTPYAARPLLSHSPYADVIVQNAAENHVPPELAAAVVQIESRFNPHVANHGALGLMQIKPQTARGVGFSGPVSALYIPEVNLAFGIRYLAQAYRMADGDTCGTLMRYQSGLGTSHMSRANRSYCAKAKAIMG